MCEYVLNIIYIYSVCKDVHLQEKYDYSMDYKIDSTTRSKASLWSRNHIKRNTTCGVLFCIFLGDVEMLPLYEMVKAVTVYIHPAVVCLSLYYTPVSYNIQRKIILPTSIYVSMLYSATSKNSFEIIQDKF
jgi:hypothetical protein